MITTLLKKYRETIIYIACGIATVLFGLGVYLSLYSTIGDILANSVSFILSVLFAYFVNAKFVFRTQYSWLSFYTFFSMRIALIFASNAGLWFLLYVNCPRIFAQFILTVLLTVFNYFISKLFIFIR